MSTRLGFGGLGLAGTVNLACVTKAWCDRGLVSEYSFVVHWSVIVARGLLALGLAGLRSFDGHWVLVCASGPLGYRNFGTSACLAGWRKKGLAVTRSRRSRLR